MVRLLIRSLIDRLNSGTAKIVKFYPYTSITANRVVESGDNESDRTNESLQELFDLINKQLIENHINPDNKTVVRIQIHRGEDNYWITEESDIFVGKYDGRISIGFSVMIEKGYEKYIKTL